MKVKQGKRVTAFYLKRRQIRGGRKCKSLGRRPKSTDGENVGRAKNKNVFSLTEGEKSQ